MESTAQETESAAITTVEQMNAATVEGTEKKAEDAEPGPETTELGVAQSEDLGWLEVEAAIRMMQVAGKQLSRAVIIVEQNPLFEDKRGPFESAQSVVVHTGTLDAKTEMEAAADAEEAAAADAKAEMKEQKWTAAEVATAEAKMRLDEEYTGWSVVA